MNPEEPQQVGPLPLPFAQMPIPHQEQAHDLHVIVYINGQPHCTACGQNGEPFACQEGPQAHIESNRHRQTRTRRLGATPCHPCGIMEFSGPAAYQAHMRGWKHLSIVSHEGIAWWCALCNKYSWAGSQEAHETGNGHQRNL